MQFRLLGPVEAYVGEVPLQLGGVKPRTLLAALLIDHDRVVPGSRLIDAVWGARPPHRARNVLQTYVSTLRQVLGRAGAVDAIVTRSPGYTLRLGGWSLDRDLFERLLAEGREAAAHGRHRDAAELLRAAAAEWRGSALSGVDSALLSGEAARLDQLRLAAVEDRISADLALGRFDAISAELVEMVGQHPFQERIRGQLMMALCGLGRRTDALAVYHEGRKALVDELGIEPGPELRSVHDAILRDSLVLPKAASAVPVAGPAGPVPVAALVCDQRPAQLPPAPADFTGRLAEATALMSALAEDGSPEGIPVPAPVQIIVGKGGSGKSALATLVAHALAPDHPDGQLYVELRGLSDEPADPHEVLGRFLQALGVASGDLPATIEGRIGRYRSMVAGRRILVLLDDAANEAQVRPLLPGAAGVSVIVTSRTHLMGLAAADVTELDVMTSGESMAMFAGIVGVERIRGDEISARRIVDRCAGLPLAIRIAGARLASRPRWPLRLLADRLVDERRRLDELVVGDQDVRVTIAGGYRSLDEPARAALRVLGLLGLPDFASWVVAAALDLSEDAAEQVVERLVDAQFVDFASVDGVSDLRYRMHDLVRIFARERAEAEMGEYARRRIVARVLGHWLRLLEIVESGPPAAASVTAGVVAGHPSIGRVARRASANPFVWLHTEYGALMTAIRLAGVMDFHQLADDLAKAVAVGRAVPADQRNVEESLT